MVAPFNNATDMRYATCANLSKTDAKSTSNE